MFHNCPALQGVTMLAKRLDLQAFLRAGVRPDAPPNKRVRRLPPGINVVSCPICHSYSCTLLLCCPVMCTVAAVDPDALLLRAWKLLCLCLLDLKLPCHILRRLDRIPHVTAMLPEHLSHLEHITNALQSSI